MESQPTDLTGTSPHHRLLGVRQTWHDTVSEEAVIHRLCREILPSVARHSRLTILHWRIWVETVSNLTPSGNVEIDIQKSLSAQNCATQMGAVHLVCQLCDDQPSHIWMPLLSHWYTVRPTGPMGSMTGAHRAPQTQTAHAERQASHVLRLLFAFNAE